MVQDAEELGSVFCVFVLFCKMCAKLLFLFGMGSEYLVYLASCPFICEEEKSSPRKTWKPSRKESKFHINDSNLCKTESCDEEQDRKPFTLSAVPITTDESNF
jgi:hypothetical protein